MLLNERKIYYMTHDRVANFYQFSDITLKNYKTVRDFIGPLNFLFLEKNENKTNMI